MPPLKPQCEKHQASGDDPQLGEEIVLTEADVKKICRWVDQKPDSISRCDFTFIGDSFRGEINQNRVLLECKDKKKSCAPSTEVEDAAGRLFCICPRLSRIGEYIGRKRQPRPLADKRKVGKYLYKLQPNQAGTNYWYLQYTENGRSKQVYLGKDEPAFDPRKDLDRVRRKQAQKKRSAEATAESALIATAAAR